MVEISLVFSSEGLIKKLLAKGHSGFAKNGEDLVCSSLSFLLRTVYVSFESLPGIEIYGQAKKPGDLEFEIRKITDNSFETFKGICLVLLSGLDSLSKDYPEFIKVIKL